MIYINTDGLENISDLLVALASQTENEFYRAKAALMELQENTQFQSYPQYVSACETMSHATDELFRLKDTLNTLMNILLSASGDYIQEEKKKVELLRKVTDCLASVSYNLSVAVETSGKAEVEKSDEMLSMDEIQKLVADSNLQMQMTNIAAVSKKVQEEYEVNKITPIDPVYAVEVKDNRKEEEETKKITPIDPVYAVEVKNDRKEEEE